MAGVWALIGLGNFPDYSSVLYRNNEGMCVKLGE